MLRGIDTSHYEPEIDWKKAQDDNVHFVFMKASQGIKQDPEFQRMWAEAKGVMPRGAYHFFDGLWLSRKPQRQVETFLKALDGDLGELPLVIDIEGVFAYGPGRYTGWKNWYNFIAYLQQEVPDKQIMIYTSMGTWDRHAPRRENLAYFLKYPLWVANYKAKTPRLPRGWVDWLFWQYSQDAFVDGVIGGSHRPTTVDVNWFNGDADALALLAGQTPEPTPEPTPDLPPTVQPVVTVIARGDVKIEVEYDN